MLYLKQNVVELILNKFFTVGYFCMMQFLSVMVIVMIYCV
jgi:hypothetical protein